MRGERRVTGGYTGEKRLQGRGETIIGREWGQVTAGVEIERRIITRGERVRGER